MWSHRDQPLLSSQSHHDWLIFCTAQTISATSRPLQNKSDVEQHSRCSPHSSYALGAEGQVPQDALRDVHIVHRPTVSPNPAGFGVCGAYARQCPRVVVRLYRTFVHNLQAEAGADAAPTASSATLTVATAAGPAAAAAVARASAGRSERGTMMAKVTTGPWRFRLGLPPGGTLARCSSKPVSACMPGADVRTRELLACYCDAVRSTLILGLPGLHHTSTWLLPLLSLTKLQPGNVCNALLCPVRMSQESERLFVPAMKHGPLCAAPQAMFRFGSRGGSL